MWPPGWLVGGSAQSEVTDEAAATSGLPPEDTVCPHLPFPLSWQNRASVPALAICRGPPGGRQSSVDNARRIIPVCLGLSGLSADSLTA